jgi:hypothetical protein
MMPCREVAPAVWLGFARCPPVSGASARGQRWSCDREAADRAVAAVLEASGYRRDACATSRSHTRGVGAAVAAPSGVRVGVDLVEVDRVGRRHAEAILSGEEWEALAPFAAVRPALGWALKEAAAKAAGDPLGCFPHGLSIAAAAGGLTLTAPEFEALELAAGWGLFEGFLYAWVAGDRSVTRSQSPAVLNTEASRPRRQRETESPCLGIQQTLPLSAAKGSCPPRSSHSRARSLAFARDDRSSSRNFVTPRARAVPGTPDPGE